MAGTFEAFGNEVRSTMAGFAESVSGEIISSISPIIYTGIMIYFFARAYQITTGRAEGAIPDLITQCVKIVLVAFFGLNAANFVTYVIPAVYGIENLLLNAISHATTGGGISNAWGAADQTWETFMSGFQAIYNIWSNSSWSVWSIGESIATSLFIILLMVLMLAVCIYFMSCRRLPAALRNFSSDGISLRAAVYLHIDVHCDSDVVRRMAQGRGLLGIYAGCGGWNPHVN